MTVDARHVSAVELRTVEAILEAGDIRRAAQRMALSPRTVSGRLTRMYAGLGVRGFAQAVDALHRNGQLR
jgi:DNA-binding transcriptional LysR family regulator